VTVPLVLGNGAAIASIVEVSTVRVKLIALAFLPAALICLSVFVRPREVVNATGRGGQQILCQFLTTPDDTSLPSCCPLMSRGTSLPSAVDVPLGQ
jgi:hypothetical protein